MGTTGRGNACPVALNTEIQKFYIMNFLAVLPALANVLSSAAEVIKRCQGSSRHENLGPLYRLPQRTSNFARQSQHFCKLRAQPRKGKMLHRYTQERWGNGQSQIPEHKVCALRLLLDSANSWGFGVEHTESTDNILPF